MSNLRSIDLKVNKIKRSLEKDNPNNLLMFIGESEDLSYAVINLQYNGKNETIDCYSLEEYEDILERFKRYNKQIFFEVKRPHYEIESF